MIVRVESEVVVTAPVRPQTYTVQLAATRARCRGDYVVSSTHVFLVDGSAG